MLRFRIFEQVIELILLNGTFCFKTLSLCPKTSERAWAKSVNLISACNVEWRNSNSFNNTLILDFF